MRTIKDALGQLRYFPEVGEKMVLLQRYKDKPKGYIGTVTASLGPTTHVIGGFKRNMGFTRKRRCVETS